MSIRFPAGSAYLTFGNGALTDNIFASPGGSIAFWLYTTGDTAAASYAVTKGTKISGSFSLEWFFGPVWSVAGDPYYFQRSWQTNGQWKFGNATNDLNEWHHFAICYDESATGNVPTIYYDGVAQSLTAVSNPAGGLYSFVDTPLTVGNITSDLDRDYVGDVYDFRVFRGKILTVEQVGYLAAGGTLPIGGESIWTSCMEFAAVASLSNVTLTTSNLAPDLAGGGYPGTPTGSPTAEACEAPRLPVWIPRAFYSVGALFTQAAAGALTFAGTIVRKDKKPVAGAQTNTGALSRKTTKPGLAGALTFAGALVRKTKKALTGALTFSGALTALRTAYVVITGALSFAGGLVRKTKKPVTGALTFAGVLVRKTKKVLSGAITFVGGAGRAFTKSLSGALTFVGSLSRKTKLSPSGAITFIGTVVRSTVVYILAKIRMFKNPTGEFNVIPDPAVVANMIPDPTAEIQIIPSPAAYIEIEPDAEAEILARHN